MDDDLPGAGSQIKLTVVIPLYAGVKYIAETLDSLLQQTIPLHEVIVVDDGSSDDGAVIAGRHPIKPRVVSTPNRGVASARNLGCLEARGTHVAFLDQDDLWLPTRHEELAANVAAMEPSLIVTGEIAFYHERDRAELVALGDELHKGALCVRGDLPGSLAEQLPAQDRRRAGSRRLTTRDLLEGPVSLSTSFVVPRDLWLAAGGFSPAYRGFDDYVGLLTFSLIAPVFSVDAPTVGYRIHPGANSKRAQWDLSMTVASCALRHGGALAPVRYGRNPKFVPSVRSDRSFWLAQLAAVSRAPGRSQLSDALACLQLAGTSRSEKMRVGQWLVRQRVSAVLQRRWHLRGP